MDRAHRAELIARYRAGADAVDAALAGAGDAELDAVPPGGGWSPRMVVHHLADSESNSYLRVRKLLAEAGPVVQGYDEAEYARRLHYDRPVETSLAVFRAVRASTAELLERLEEHDWGRVGTHTESGPYTVDDWLEIYAAHAFDHAEQIRRVRGAA
jgi:hypothetical protein